MKKRNLITILLISSLVLILVFFLVGCKVPKTGRPIGAEPSIEPIEEPSIEPTTKPSPSPSPIPDGSPDPHGLAPGGDTLDWEGDDLLSERAEAVMAPAVVLPTSILPPECSDDPNCLCFFPMYTEEDYVLSYNPITREICEEPEPPPPRCEVIYCNDGSIRRGYPANNCEPFIPCVIPLPPIEPRRCIQIYCPCGQNPYTCQCNDCPDLPRPPECPDEYLITNQGWVRPNPYDNCYYPVPPPPPREECHGRYHLERPCIYGEEVPQQHPGDPCRIICVPKRSGSRPECEGKLQLCPDGTRRFLDPITCQSNCPPGRRQPEPGVCEKPQGLGLCIYNDGSIVRRYWDYKTCNWIPPRCPPKSPKAPPPPGCGERMARCGDGTWAPVDPITCRPICPFPRRDECPIWFMTNPELRDLLLHERLPNGCFRIFYRAV